MGARMTLLEIKHLSKRFHRVGTPTVNDVNFSLEAGKIVALLGPSGCGKTTTLRLIAGFEQPDAGEINLENRRLFGAGIDLPPEARGIGFVFQDYALFPHLSVLENVIFGLHHLPKSERLERAREVLALVGLLVFQDRAPHQLSGGQQQRVALARALAPRPKLILLDEPFSSLDAQLRASTRLEVRRILEKIGATALLVTHDQEEAMAFADRLIVMRDGRIEQEGSPERVYAQPRTAFVANFLGRTNLIPGRANGLTCKTIFGEVKLESPANGPIMLSIRPEDLSFVDSPANTLQATVIAREFKGHDITYALESGGLQLIVQTDHLCNLNVGDLTHIKLEGPAVPVRGSE
jgi:iron(III) transport system ATP-binding protein